VQPVVLVPGNDSAAVCADAGGGATALKTAVANAAGVAVSKVFIVGAGATSGTAFRSCSLSSKANGGAGDASAPRRRLASSRRSLIATYQQLVVLLEVIVPTDASQLTTSTTGILANGTAASVITARLQALATPAPDSAAAIDTAAFQTAWLRAQNLDPVLLATQGYNATSPLFIPHIQTGPSVVAVIVPDPSPATPSFWTIAGGSLAVGILSVVGILVFLLLAACCIAAIRRRHPAARTEDASTTKWTASPMAPTVSPRQPVFVMRENKMLLTPPAGGALQLRTLSSPSPHNGPSATPPDSRRSSMSSPGQDSRRPSDADRFQAPPTAILSQPQHG
jgi:hypothetical protein